MSCIHLVTSRQLPGDFYVLEEDVVVLLAEGSYLVSANELKTIKLANIYVLQEDLQMRGLSGFSEHFKSIEYQELVNLVLKHEKSITW